jgi:hypothetical protein
MKSNRKMLSAAASLVASLLLAVAGYAAPPQQTISIDGQRVTATGFHPGRTVVLFGVGTAPGPYFSRFLSYTETRVADANGSVTYEIVDGVPKRSVWFAIDAQTRDYVVLEPNGVSTSRRTLQRPVAKRGADAGNDAIAIDSNLADILIVRAGNAVWAGSCGRNSTRDLNAGKPGSMHLSLGNVKAIEKGGGPPASILPSDLVVVVDSQTLSYYAGLAAQF